MPAAYVLGVIAWAAVVAICVLVALPVALALGLLVMAGTVALHTGRVALRICSTASTTGPSPATSRAEGDRAYSPYVMAQQWHDVDALIRGVIPWTYQSAASGIGWLTSTLLTDPKGFVLFPIWLGACAGVIVAAVPLAIAGIGMTLGVAVLTGAGVAVWLLLTVVLGGLERLRLVYHRILIACPHPNCYRRFALPEYACPICDTRHDHLLPGRLGALFHVCRCGARLPTTILGGRFRLPAYCPHCHRRLPARIGRARVEPLPFVGGPAAGKTTLMVLAVRALRAGTTAHGGRATFVEARHAGAYRGALAELSRGAQLAKTGPELPMATMVDVTMPRAGRRILYLFDPAGEHYTGATAVEALRYLDHGEALLFVVDPFALPELRRSLTPDEEAMVTAATATSEEDPADTLARLLAELRSRPDGGRQRRIAVVVTKADVLRRTAVGVGFDTDVRGWLSGLGLGNTVRTLERSAAEVRYFASGLDSPPDALADLFGWTANLPLNSIPNPLNQSVSDVPRPGMPAMPKPGTPGMPGSWMVDELIAAEPPEHHRKPGGRPPGVIPLNYQIGRWLLFAVLALTGPAAVAAVILILVTHLAH